MKILGNLSSIKAARQCSTSRRMPSRPIMNVIVLPEEFSRSLVRRKEGEKEGG